VSESAAQFKELYASWRLCVGRRAAGDSPIRVPGRSLVDLPARLPLLLVRSGRAEIPGLNATMDRFVVECLRPNLTLSLVNYSESPHAFDLFHDSPNLREIVRQVLAFLVRDAAAAAARKAASRIGLTSSLNYKCRALPRRVATHPPGSTPR
jgi:hypothetical protein